MVSVYQYLDYREYLKDFIKEEKAQKSQFSYQYFANRAGFKSKDFLYRVIHGQRNLSRRSCLKVSKGVGHNQKESEYFEYLVEWNQTSDFEEKQYYLNKLQRVAKSIKGEQKVSLLTFEQLQVMSNVRHMVIRSIIDMYPFSGDYETLAKQVWPSIKVNEAKESISLLEKVGLIEKTENDVYSLTDKCISTGNNVEKQCIESYYKQCFRLAGDSISSFSAAERNISGMIVGVSDNAYQKIVEKINKLKKEVTTIVSEDSEASRVYSMQLNFFPMMNLEKKR